MDKSTLLNEIINHANFKDELIKALCGDDTIKDHFYSYDFNKRYTHFDISDELRADLIKALLNNLDSVKSTFLESFKNASLCALYELLASLEGSWGYDFNELIDHDLDDCLIDAFKLVYSNYRPDLNSTFRWYLFAYVDGKVDYDIYNVEGEQYLAIESVVNDHLDNFEFETNIFASVFNCGGVVCAINAYHNGAKYGDEFEDVFGNMLRRGMRDICELD